MYTYVPRRVATIILFSAAATSYTYRRRLCNSLPIRFVYKGGCELESWIVDSAARLETPRVSEEQRAKDRERPLKMSHQDDRCRTSDHRTEKPFRRKAFSKIRVVIPVSVESFRLRFRIPLNRFLASFKRLNYLFDGFRFSVLPLDGFR